MADLAESVFTAVRGYIDRELGKLELKIYAEQRSAIGAIKPAERGERGEKGEPGESIVGPPGDKGDRGEKGEPGESIKGDKGDPGEPGVSVKGERGERGERGEIGPRGEPGPPGQSVKGDKGDRGEPGEKGDSGESVEGRPGQRGEKGEVGERGERGERGEKGDRGEQGIPGVSIKGEKGEKGDRGDEGDPGRDGKKGDPGRDAAQIDLIAGIDHERCYPRGTFASFYGGTFYATRETDPLENNDRPTLCGWHPAMNGIKSDIEMLEDGGRFRVRTVTLSDGTVSVQKQKTKMQIFRGVHQAGRAYDEGDVTIFDGSQWTAVEDTKERPKARDPSGPQAWALCVKHGKDGRNAIARSYDDDNRAPLQ